MSRAELDTAIEWAASEGWNPGLHDADAYYASDPDGYFVGMLDNELIGSISAVKYSDDFAFMGFFIVKPELRGGMLGPRLADEAFRYVGNTPVGLDGVLEQAGHYAALWGFEPAYHNMRYQGVVARSGDVDAHIAAYDVTDFDAVAAYDEQCFPAPRRPFLERWLAEPEASVLVYRDGGALRGYGMIRHAQSGHRIGPLFADDAATAEALFEALVAHAPEGEPVYMDVPQPNEAALRLVTDRGMAPVFETARMYRGAVRQIALEKVFGVTTLELG